MNNPSYLSTDLKTPSRSKTTQTILFDKAEINAWLDESKGA